MSDEFNVSDVSNNDGVVIRPGEMYYAIKKWAVNKACGPEQKKAEHLKHQAWNLSATCNVFFWVLNAWHATCHFLESIVKDKAGKV